MMTLGIWDLDGRAVSLDFIQDVWEGRRVNETVCASLMGDYGVMEEGTGATWRYGSQRCRSSVCQMLSRMDYRPDFDDALEWVDKVWDEQLN